MSAQQLILVGTSYKTAPAEERERHQERLLELVSRIHSRTNICVLATCNRFEIYADGPEDALVADEAGLYRLEGVEAVEHLMRVACGVESAVLGDVQILAQIKQARANVTSTYLDRLLLTAIRAGKRARSETAVGSGRASVGSAIAGMLRARADTCRRILILGAGEAARAIGAHLAKSGFGELCWMNRTGERAAELAERFGGRARPWAELREALRETDAVVAATGAPKPVVTRAMLTDAHPSLIIDAGMPRNVEAGASASIVNIDSIREHQHDVLRRRRAAIPAVEAIVSEAVDEWSRWLDARRVEDVIRGLYAEVGASARETAETLAAADTSSVDAVEAIVERAIRRLLHRPIRSLRALQ